MSTVLARRLKSARRLLAESPGRFEVHQLLRVLLRADPDREPEVVAAERPGGMAVTPPTRSTPARVEIDPTTMPANTALARYLVWELAHPFAAAERNAPSGEAFIREAAACAGMPRHPGLPVEFMASAAGAIRRGGAGLAAVCEEYFGVPAALEPVPDGAGLRVGPLGLNEYLGFAAVDGEAWKHLTAWAELLLGPGVRLCVRLVLKADEVPACVPGRVGATPGLTAWPLPERGTHRQDVETWREWPPVEERS
ncbi:MAG: hypothetical protein U0871_29475 [Gemmataceae bacterium]